MSFRLRLFGLIATVAVVAIALTAWLSLSLASQQFAGSAARAQRDIVETAEVLAVYGRTHGTWVGVDEVVRGRSRAVDQRIRLVSTGGEVIVDSDHLEGRAARPVIGSPARVDPRLQLPVQPRDQSAEPVDGIARAEQIMVLIQQYRDSMKSVTCARDQGYDDARVADTAPFTPRATGRIPAECVAEGRSGPIEFSDDEAAVKPCGFLASAKDMDICFAEAIASRTYRIAAPTAQLFVGAVDDSPWQLVSLPMLAGAAGILAIAVAGTALIARRLGGPIGRLTRASQQLADGRLDVRVPESGSDELATLSRSFNKMAEAIQESEQRQRRLVADVAHELRTPLSNVGGYLEALQDSVVQPSKELFASLYEETQLQQRILDDLQVLALAEAGTLTYRREPVDLPELLQTAGMAHRAVAADAGVSLLVDAEAELGIHGDHQRLRQVLGNLITNAVRHTNAGGRVLVRGWATGEAQAVVTVSDTGCGIAADDLAHVFDRFWRADPARQRSTGGSGLGLTIARRIVVDHGGHIDVRSEENVGTTFAVTLPRGPAPLLGRARLSTTNGNHPQRWRHRG